MQLAGLSMDLGAFLAGVLLAESKYRREPETNIEPFKGLLLGLFFIAVGMGINLCVLAHFPLQMFAIVVGFLALKAVAISMLVSPLILVAIDRWLLRRADARGDFRTPGRSCHHCRCKALRVARARGVTHCKTVPKFRQHNLELFNNSIPSTKTAPNWCP